MTQNVLAYREGATRVSRRADVHLSRIVLLLGSVLMLLVATWQIGETSNGRGNWPLHVTTACFAWLAIYTLSSYAYFRTIYLFSGFYVAALILFHLAAPIGEALDWFPGLATAPDIHPRWLELSGWYVILALASFGIGQAVSMGTRSSGGPGMRGLAPAVRAFLFRDAIGLLLVSCAMLLWTFATVGNLLSYSRTELFRGVGDTRGLGVFLMVFPSALLLLVFAASNGVPRAAAALLALGGFALIMLSGYRTSAIYPLIVGAILWRKSGHRIPFPVAAATVAFLVLAISFIGVLRQSGPYAAMDRAAVESALQQTSTRDTFHLGQTGALLAHVLRLVPSQDGYRYGLTYVEGLKQAIPNMSSHIGESPRQAVKRGVFTRATFEQLIPSDWLTYRIAPWAFDIGQGVGFTAIGEAYLNFGLVGVAAFFALLGYCLGRLDRMDVAHRPYWFLFCGAFLWHLMRTVRDDFTNFTKPAVFTLIILVGWRIATYIVGWRPRVPRT